MSPITTHILDTSIGRPAEGVAITLERRVGDDWSMISTAETNADGRVAGLMEAGSLEADVYRISFDTGAYFAGQKRACFYPYVRIVFEITAPDQHYHVPLLLNPYGYSTYRGS